MAKVAIDIPNDVYEVLLARFAPSSVEHGIRCFLFTQVMWELNHRSRTSAARQSIRDRIFPSHCNGAAPSRSAAIYDAIYAACRAERLFREAVTQMVEGGFTVEILEELGAKGISFSVLFKELGYDINPPEDLHPDGQYLLSLTDNRILDLIREAAPQYADVLDKNPRAAH